MKDAVLTFGDCNSRVMLQGLGQEIVLGGTWAKGIGM